MKFLVYIIFLVSFSAFAQFDNELKKTDSVFVYFSESKVQKIYSKVNIENSIELKYVTYKFHFDDGKNCNFTINQLFNHDSNGNKVFKSYKLKRSFLRKNKHKIITYDGLYTPIKKNNYNKKKFRANLRFTNKRILEYSTAIGKPNRGAIVFIKPSKKSTYGNLVDIIEEMRLANIEAYTIINEFTPEEEKLLASN